MQAMVMSFQCRADNIGGFVTEKTAIHVEYGKYVCNMYKLGNSCKGLPDMYVYMCKCLYRPRDECIYFRQITSKAVLLHFAKAYIVKNQ